MKPHLRLCLALLSGALCVHAGEIPVNPATQTDQKWKLAFGDEFDGDAIDGTRHAVTKSP
jgi:hypothetical protein